jgi:hypothetical protein
VAHTDSVIPHTRGARIPAADTLAGRVLDVCIEVAPSAKTAGNRGSGRKDERMKNQAKMQMQIARLPHGADLPLPSYQSELAAGLDLYAA